MAVKLHLVRENWYAFHCPGCQCAHMIPVNGEKTDNGHGWQWNGSLERPTLNPSILVHSHPQHRMPPTPRCHLFVRDGTVMYLADCTHELAGKTVEIPDWGG
jgi:hypothetical protein